MSADKKHLSEFQIALRNFKKNRLACLGVVILGLLYVAVIFAEFLSPYSYKNENRNYSYCPPTVIQFFDENRLVWPYVYGRQLEFNAYHGRIYTIDKTQKYPLRFFAPGDTYQWLGFLPGRRHLIGVSEPGPFYLLGADSRGRDVFSRPLYGGRIS